MILRRAALDDLSYIVALEQTYGDQGFIGNDAFAVHEQRLKDPDCWYAIVETEGGPGGYVILRGLTSSNRSIELKRIAIAEPGRGLGRQVLKAIFTTAFDEFGAHRIWLDVFTDNHRARHLYRSAGLIEEGVMRECVKYRDQYRSLVLMSMLESEYRALPRS